MIRIVCLVNILIASTLVVYAEPYWFAYEGNDLPENEGWTRHTNNPIADRWLEDGSFFLDTRADTHIADTYTVYPDESFDPEPDEIFIMQWRLKIHEAAPWDDPGVYIISDDQYAVALVFAEGYVLSTFEHDVYAFFEPGVFHEFELHSSDMRSYQLYIDDDLAIEGLFDDSFISPCAGWGDTVKGSASLSEWDYFGFGVVPEPSGCLMTLITLLSMRMRNI